MKTTYRQIVLQKLYICTKVDSQFQLSIFNLFSLQIHRRLTLRSRDHLRWRHWSGLPRWRTCHPRKTFPDRPRKIRKGNWVPRIQFGRKYLAASLLQVKLIRIKLNILKRLFLIQNLSSLKIFHLQDYFWEHIKEFKEIWILKTMLYALIQVDQSAVVELGLGQARVRAHERGVHCRHEEVQLSGLGQELGSL